MKSRGGVSAFVPAHGGALRNAPLPIGSTADEHLLFPIRTDRRESAANNFAVFVGAGLVH
jgi:hypothetical protein